MNFDKNIIILQYLSYPEKIIDSYERFSGISISYYFYDTNINEENNNLIGIMESIKICLINNFAEQLNEENYVVRF
jgi:hypothetical protein